MFPVVVEVLNVEEITDVHRRAALDALVNRVAQWFDRNQNVVGDPEDGGMTARIEFTMNRGGTNLDGFPLLQIGVEEVISDPVLF